MKRDKQRRVERGTQTRWMTYASAGSVALASGGIVDMNFVASPECVADLVTFDGTLPSGHRHLDLDGGGGWPPDLQMEFNNNTSNMFRAFNGGVPAQAGTTPGGAFPSSGFTVHRYSSGSYHSWPNAASQFFAFRLNVTGYGWIKVDAGSAGNALVYEGAYDTAATSPIQVGAVPEPSSFALLGLLATGAAGVMAWKRCRRQQQQGDGVEE